jgi:putative membrane protein
MISNKKIFLSGLFIGLLAEILLIFLIYLNPYKISPIMPQSLQMWVNCLCNLSSSIALFIAFYKIKKKSIKAHKRFIGIALFFSSLFLINYILYHMSIGHTIYTNIEFRSLYLFILGSHLIASLISLPLIFITVAYGFFDRLREHKKLAFSTFILWQYVSITGVLIVLFLKFLN